MTDWTTCRVVRDRAGDLWFRIRGDMWFDGDVRIGSEGLGSNYGLSNRSRQYLRSLVRRVNVHGLLRHGPLLSCGCRCSG